LVRNILVPPPGLVLPGVRGLDRDPALLGSHDEPLSRDERGDLVDELELLAEGLGEEADARPDLERPARPPDDALDVLVPGGRIVGVGREGSDLFARPVDHDLRVDLDRHSRIVPAPF
jgi:hypothetical protein